jgi:hypothetical protein
VSEVDLANSPRQSPVRLLAGRLLFCWWHLVYSPDAIRRSGIEVGERAQLRRLSRTRARDQPVGEMDFPVVHHRYPTGVSSYQTKTFAIVGGTGAYEGASGRVVQSAPDRSIRTLKIVL